MSAGLVLLVILGVGIAVAVKYKKLGIMTLLTCASFGGLLFTETGLGAALHGQLVAFGSWVMTSMGAA